MTLGAKYRLDGFTFGAGVFRSHFEDARNESWRGGPVGNLDFETEGYVLSATYIYNWN